MESEGLMKRERKILEETTRDVLSVIRTRGKRKAFSISKGFPFSKSFLPPLYGTNSHYFIYKKNS